MKKIIVGIIVCLLLSLAFTSAVSSIPLWPTDEKNTPRINLYEDSYQWSQHKAVLGSLDEFIVELIEQLTETMYLGYLENITAFGPRVTGTSASYQAGDYIYNEFQSMGLEVRYHNWNNGGYQDRNIEGTLYGVNQSSDEIYIIFAHFDTVANCPGADDDGSGVATVLSAAYILSQYEFNHTIRFVAFSGEEQWMLGSHEYAYEAYLNGDNIVAVLNVDMIGFAITAYHGDNIRIYYNAASLWLTDFTDDISEQYYDYINLNVVPSGSTPSDQWYFWQYGFDGIFYHEYEFNYYYHEPQDTIENMNITYATKCSKLVLATLAELTQLYMMSYPPYPPSIEGPTIGAEEIEYDYTFLTTDPEGEDVYYFIDWGDGTFSDWIGPYSSGEEISVSHMWSSPGEYEVRAKARDIYNYQSQRSDVLLVTIVENGPPDTPDISGPTTGKPGEEYGYTFVTNDPDGDDVSYYIKWGDGDITEWTTSQTSGSPGYNESHIWSVQGTYTIQAQAKDIYGAESDWGELEISMPRNKQYLNRSFLNFLQSHPNLFSILRELILRLGLQ